MNDWDLDALRNSTFGFIFQAFHILEDLDVLENVLLPARIARKSVSRGNLYYMISLLFDFSCWS